MRLPDYEDSLDVAAKILDVDRAEVESMIKSERLHQAILKPAACAGGAPLYRTRGEILKCLFVSCSQDRIVPRRKVRFGWMMVQRTIQLSGYRWRPRRGDQDRLKEFGEQLTEGIDPGKPLADWLEERTQPLPGAAEELPPRPLHVTSSMSNLTEEQAERMAALSNAVDDGLSKFLDAYCKPEAARTLRPQVHPTIAVTDAALHTKIEARLHTADGLIVLAPQPSWGSAMEVEIGLRGLIPTLFLHPASCPPGKRARIRLEAAQATVLAFDDDPDDPKVAATEIAELVYHWLVGAHVAILGMARRRESVNARLSRFHRNIQLKRTQMGGAEERKALAAAGIAEARAHALIEEDWHLQFASVTELLALSNAYAVPANIDGIVHEPAGDRPPFLTDFELDRLGELVRIDRIPSVETIEMVRVAQEELALPGRRRKEFTTLQSWRSLRARINRKP